VLGDSLRGNELKEGDKMSLVPAFELGLWNGWIFVLLGFLAGPVVGSLTKKEAMKKAHVTPPYSRTEKNVERVFTLLWIASMVYSIFLPLKLGTVWFYVGLPICFLSLIISFTSIISFVTTPMDELVTKGAYSISRNPACLAKVLLDVSIGIACASWIYLLYAMVDITLMHVSLGAEERFLLEKYGSAYREYMNRTPRWIGILKSEKKD